MICFSIFWWTAALNVTFLHCLQHSLFEHLFNLYYITTTWKHKRYFPHQLNGTVQLHENTRGTTHISWMLQYNYMKTQEILPTSAECYPTTTWKHKRYVPHQLNGTVQLHEDTRGTSNISWMLPYNYMKTQEVRPTLAECYRAHFK